MGWLRSWRGLFGREYLEHRLPFVWFPLGILALFALAAISGLFANRVQLSGNLILGHALKLYELGDLLLIGLWLVYLAVALFFYFGDAFSADRRNNAMLFWKSMPVSDLRILASKFLAGLTLFPLLVFAIALISGLLLYGAVLAAGYTFPGFTPPPPATALWSFAHIGVFGFYYLVIALLWYAPFFAWVGGLSTIFGRWSLPLAFLIPGVLSVVENMVAFGYVPRGGYFWGYLSRRLQFGLSEYEYGFLVAAPVQFDARTYIWLLSRETDWLSIVTGLVFAALVIWLASEYRRRRLF